MASVIPLRSLPLGEPKEPGHDDNQKEGEDKESEQDPILNGMKKVLSNSSGRPTSGDIVGAIEISAKRRHKLARPSAARLTLWWIEPGELVRFTLDPKPVELGADLNGRRNGADELDREDDEENTVVSATG